MKAPSRYTQDETWRGAVLAEPVNDSLLQAASAGRHFTGERQGYWGTRSASDRGLLAGGADAEVLNPALKEPTRGNSLLLRLGRERRGVVRPSAFAILTRERRQQEASAIHVGTVGRR